MTSNALTNARKRFASNIASSCYQRYTEDSVFWLTQMTLYIITWYKFPLFVKHNVIWDVVQKTVCRYVNYVWTDLGEGLVLDDKVGSDEENGRLQQFEFLYPSLHQPPQHGENGVCCTLQYHTVNGSKYDWYRQGWSLSMHFNEKNELVNIYSVFP